MRILMSLLLGVMTLPANASEADRVRDHVNKCLPLPVDAVDNHLMATFEVTLDSTGNVKSVVVVSQEPNSKAMKEAALKLATSVEKCWPAGVMTSPTRITIDLK